MIEFTKTFPSVDPFAAMDAVQDAQNALYHVALDNWQTAVDVQLTMWSPHPDFWSLPTKMLNDAAKDVATPNPGSHSVATPVKPAVAKLVKAEPAAKATVAPVAAKTTSAPAKPAAKAEAPNPLKTVASPASAKPKAAPKAVAKIESKPVVKAEVAQPAPASKVEKTAPVKASVSKAKPAKSDVTQKTAPATSPAQEPKQEKATVDAKPVAAKKAEPAPVAAKPVTPTSNRPKGLKAPRAGGADNLKEIKGVGPKLETLLNSMGVFHFDQIAKWSAAEAAWMDDNLDGFTGRVMRDTWVDQAKTLAKAAKREDKTRAPARGTA